MSEFARDAGRKHPPNAFSRHSMVRVLMHVVWSTRERMPWIHRTIEGRLHAYIVGICRRDGCYVVAVGGVEDHVHLLLYLGHAITISDLVRDVKGGSSHFMRSELDCGDFQWQRGYAAFGVSPENRDGVADYVRSQRQHHETADLWPAAERLASDTDSSQDDRDAADAPAI